MSLTRQAEYLAIAEHMAFVNPRVRSFSQYLLGDDKPRKARSLARYGGFESGLRRANGKAKPSYDAFRLPLAAEAYGPSDVLWGRVRPSATKTQVTILASRRKGKPFKPLRTLQTNSRGVYGLRAEAPRQAALPRAVDRAGRQGLARAADPRRQITRTIPSGAA